MEVKQKELYLKTNKKKNQFFGGFFFYKWWLYLKSQYETKINQLFIIQKACDKTF